ncbi:MAG: hypothetical protein J3Q66DRAFT_359161 [Benniella sp.]|nr:MAG: hypothetical protein J3Q66DRAFT_359161 [Benniella sp.]
MQRGLQVITPDADYKDSREKDPFTSPRSSSDFSRRVSAILAPTRSSTQQSETLPSPHELSTTAVAAAAAAAAAVSASSRIVGQRRVSLPSIIEAPSSPVMVAAPRQSCDLSRVPLLNEPLDPRLGSSDFGRGISAQQRPSPDQVKPAQSQDKKTNDKQQQRWKLAQSALPNFIKTLDLSPNTLRRRSVDAQVSGYLSPPPTRPVLRRASFDQLAAIRPGDNKPRRDSDASNAETIVSSPSSCSTLASPMTLSGNNSRTKLDMSPLQESCLMARSISQPPQSPLGNGSMRRITSASEPGPRQSFDIRLFAASRDRTMSEAEDEGYYRRRSMQEPRGADMDYDERATFLRSIKMTPSASDAKPRSGKHHRGTFSGSATISGRFSRLWAQYSSGKDSQDVSFHDKESSTGSMGSIGDNNDGMWNDSDLSKTQDAGARSRSGMMNRLSGIWTRR